MLRLRRLIVLFAEQYFNLFYLSVNVYGSRIYFYYNRIALKINNFDRVRMCVVHTVVHIFKQSSIGSFVLRFCHLSFTKACLAIVCVCVDLRAAFHLHSSASEKEYEGATRTEYSVRIFKFISHITLNYFVF